MQTVHIVRFLRSRFLRRLLQYLAFACVVAFVVSTTTRLGNFKEGTGVKNFVNQTNSRTEVHGGGDDVQRSIKVLPKTRDGQIDYSTLPRIDWHDYELMKLEQSRMGNGEQGAPFVLPSDPKTVKKADEIYRQNGFSGLTSDFIALNRSIKDVRHNLCRSKKYISVLPTVSVVVPFHNEHWSTLLRTAITVTLRSPKNVLREVILVDDASTKEFLKKDLDDYVAKHLPLVKVFRTEKREGLIRARIIGIRHATSDIIVMLDSHSEPNWNWLPPLIEPIALDYRTAVCPFIDVIDCDTFEYRSQHEGGRGSFDWEFHYNVLPPSKDQQSDRSAPYENPVMVGGYFAISRKWFWELGGYDEGLDIWGGEQYELSFKIWQCGGKLLDTPCSRVGHIYRCKYVPFPDPGIGDFVSRNYRRVADVWMDEYKEYLAKRRPQINKVDPGDLTKQRAVRDRLNCKPFKWFMTKVAYDQEKYFPAIEPPNGANGELRSLGAPGKCIDTQFRRKKERFGIRECISKNPASGGEQKMRLSFWQDIRPVKRSVCFDVSTSVDHAPVVLFPCHMMHGNQYWQYRPEKHQLYHRKSNKCLDCDPERGEVFMSVCKDNIPSQQWEFEKVNMTQLEVFKHAKLR